MGSNKKPNAPQAVRFCGGEIHILSPSGNWYVTDRFGGCNCYAGERGTLCWHVRWRAQHLSDHVEALTKLGRTQADVIRLLSRDFPEVTMLEDEDGAI